MSYLAELDDGPRAVRQGYAGNVLSWWPKVAGAGNVQLAGAPTYRLFTPSGAQVGGVLAAAVAAVGDPGEQVTRVDLAVDTTATDTWALGQGYRAEVTWTFGGLERVATVRFDVARDPYAPQLSLNDFLEELGDAGQYLEGQAQTLDANRTAEQHASVLAVKAWADVYRWLQNRLKIEGNRIVPRLIVPRWKLDHVVIAQALFRLFRGEGGGEGSTVAELAAEWKAEASARFDALGALEYDEDEDGTPEAELHAPVSHRVRRSWG